MVRRWHRCPVMGQVVRIWPVGVWYRRCRERYEAEVSRQYKEAYERVPLNAPDGWGDLESFLEAMHTRPRSSGDSAASQR